MIFEDLLHLLDDLKAEILQEKSVQVVPAFQPANGSDFLLQKVRNCLDELHLLLFGGYGDS